MAITFKYGASPGAQIMAAYAGGVNRSRIRQQEQMMPLVQQSIAQQYDERRRAQERGWDVWDRAEQFERQKELQQLGFEQQIGMQEAAFEHQRGMQGANLEHDRRMQGAMIEHRQQMQQEQWDREQDIWYRDTFQRIQHGELELSPSMQAEWESMEGKRAWVENNPNLNESQREQARAQLDNWARRIIRSARPPIRKQPTIKESVQSGTHTDDRGNIWGYDRNGQPTIIQESREGKGEDNRRAQMEKDRMEARRRVEDSDRDGKGGISFDDAYGQIQREREAMEQWERDRGQPQASPTGAYYWNGTEWVPNQQNQQQQNQ